MSPHLQNLLYERYPKIFAEHTQPESQMSNGIACGDGWFDLLDIKWTHLSRQECI
jgi:hypothetical protein